MGVYIFNSASFSMPAGDRKRSASQRERERPREFCASCLRFELGKLLECEVEILVKLCT